MRHDSQDRHPESHRDSHQEGYRVNYPANYQGSQGRPRGRGNGGRLMRHLRRQIVGYVALLVALSLTPLPGWAAATIGTADLRDSAVTTRKLARGSVTAPKIARNAVRSPKITNGTVRTIDLAVDARGFRSITVRRVEYPYLDPGATRIIDVMCPAGQVAVSGGGALVPSGGGTVERRTQAAPTRSASMATASAAANAGQVTRSHPVVPSGQAGVGPVTPGEGQVPTGWRNVIHNDSTTTTYHALGYALCASK